MSDIEGRRKHLIPRRQRDQRRRSRMFEMEDRPSIASLVERAVRGGIPDPEPRRLHGLAAAALRERNMRILRDRNPAEDSGYDERDLINDHLWNSRYKYEDKEFDQHIFNVLRHDTIPQQERKVLVNTATMVRVGDEDGDIYRMWRKHVRPTISRAPRKRKMVDKEKAKRDAALHQELAEAAHDMRELSDGCSDDEQASDMEPDNQSNSSDSDGTPNDD